MRDTVYMQTARMGQALAHPHRLRALNLLAQRPRTINELAQALDESKASTSAHLKVLRAACLVLDDRRGREVWCRLASDQVAVLLVTLRRTAEDLLPELRDVVAEAAADPDLLEDVSLRQLARDAKAGRVQLIDLRTAEEYAHGHLPGARSVPEGSLSRSRLRELAAELGGQSIVAYCRGPWCLTARRGVKRLVQSGLRAKRVPAGVAEWRTDGLRLAYPKT